MSIIKRVTEAARLIFALVQGLGLSTPLVWSHTRFHLADHGLSTLVLSLRTTSYEANECSLSTDHWQDVLFGSLLGIVMAYFSYRQYFLPLASELAHLPYSPRPQFLEGTHDPAPGLPYYSDPVERERGGAVVEPPRDTVKRNEPEQVEQTWEQGPSLEGGPHLS